MPIWIGSALMTLGTGLFIGFGPTTNWSKIIIFQIVAGLGAGPLFQAPMIAFQTHLPQQDIGAASSASMFLRSLSTSVSIVVGSVLLQKGTGGGHITTGMDPVGSASGYASSMRPMWIFYTVMAGLMLFTTVFIRKSAKKEDSGIESPVQEDAESANIERSKEVA